MKLRNKITGEVKTFTKEMASVLYKDERGNFVEWEVDTEEQPAQFYKGIERHRVNIPLLVKVASTAEKQPETKVEAPKVEVKEAKVEAKEETPEATPEAVEKPKKKRAKKEAANS